MIFTGPTDQTTYENVVKYLEFDRVVVERKGYIIHHSGTMPRPAYLYWNALERRGAMRFLTNEMPEDFERKLQSGDIAVFLDDSRQN